MDSYHSFHLLSMLPGMCVTVLQPFLKIRETKSVILFNLTSLSLHGHSDSLVWYHVIRLSGSFLLDESNFGFK